jgi:hypothetical protein
VESGCWIRRSWIGVEAGTLFVSLDFLHAPQLKKSSTSKGKRRFICANQYLRCHQATCSGMPRR